jgi:hypothetical protein
VVGEGLSGSVCAPAAANRRTIAIEINKTCFIGDQRCVQAKSNLIYAKSVANGNTALLKSITRIACPLSSLDGSNARQASAAPLALLGQFRGCHNREVTREI